MEEDKESFIYYPLPSFFLFILNMLMYPYLEIFWTKLYMTWIGIVLACFALLITVYVLSKKYHQEFVRFFNWLPWYLIVVYFCGLYFSFFLNWWIIPTSLQVFSPYWYHFSLVGVVLSSFVMILIFLSQFKRNESKRVWIDILFFGFINAIIVLWVFLVLWDNFIGKTNTWAIHVTALTSDSALIKYGWVYPIGLFLSLGALAINVIVTIRKLIVKRSGLGLWWFILLFILFMAILPFWNYPAHGVLSVFWKFSLDVNHYVFIFLILFCLLSRKKLKKPY